MCTFESCEESFKQLGNDITFNLIYLHYKTTTVKKIRLKFLGYSP